MIETLEYIDKLVFIFINVNLSNPVTDFIMPWITSDWIIRLVYAIAMSTILWMGNARLRWMVLFSLILILLTDQVTATYLKNFIGRIRPCHYFDHDQINLLVNCGSGKAMPSAHSANAFAQALFWSFYDRKIRIVLFLYATLIALSRVFVGVHYPLDIIVGALVGLASGLIILFLFHKFKLKFVDKN